MASKRSTADAPDDAWSVIERRRVRTARLRAPLAREPVSPARAAQASARARAAAATYPEGATEFPVGLAAAAASFFCFRLMIAPRSPPAFFKASTIGLRSVYAVGEKVYYTGDSHTTAKGNKYTPGQEGEVTGHPQSDSRKFGKGVSVMFPGNKGHINCFLTSLSRSKP